MELCAREASGQVVRPDAADTVSPRAKVLMTREDLPGACAHIGDGGVGVGDLYGGVEDISHAFFPDIMLEIEACRCQYISVEPVRVCCRVYGVGVGHFCV